MREPSAGCRQGPMRQWCSHSKRGGNRRAYCVAGGAVTEHVGASAAPMGPPETAQLRATLPVKPPDRNGRCSFPGSRCPNVVNDEASSSANLPSRSGARLGMDRWAQVIRIRGCYFASFGSLDRSTRGASGGMVSSQFRRSLLRELRCCFEACGYAGASCMVLLLHIAN